MERQGLAGGVVVRALGRMPVRFYVGNCDRRVGTRGVFEVVNAVVERAERDGVRRPQQEFFMYRGVGKDGHGTPP